jgi:hypothetical protein
MLNRTRERSARAAFGSLRPRPGRISRGQSMVEFALVSVLGLVLMMVGVQFALIGQVALSLSQGASALARYAAVHPGSFGYNGTATVPSGASALLSPTINDGKLTVTIASYKGGTTTTTSSPAATVDRVVVTLTYDASNKIALPNPFLAIPGFFPGISFPTSLGAQDEQLYE